MISNKQNSLSISAHAFFANLSYFKIKNGSNILEECKQKV
jgi:hypothetical protein